SRHTIAGLADDNTALRGTTLHGYSIVGGRAELLEQIPAQGKMFAIVAIGDNETRMNIAGWLLKEGYSLGTAVDPSAQISSSSRVEAGTVVMPGCVINADTTVGQNCIINTSASVDHDCRIGEGVHIAPGVRLCGNVSVGQGTLLGVGSVVLPGIRIGRKAIIGANAAVTADVPDNATVVGPRVRAN
nr:serine acetyltransferase [Burkholderiales bacterium]